MTRFRTLVGLGAAWLSALPAAAQDASSGDAEGMDDTAVLALTLDGLAPVDGACRLTFVARNGLAADVASLVVEAVAFGPEGSVERIALFDFGALPVDRLRVRQFDLPGTPCEAVGSMLVNGVQTCQGEGLDAEQCAPVISVSSRAEVELLG
ncbi:MAG: hypothetical protein AAF646_07075 [Pseudomonadota bacterium]